MIVSRHGSVAASFFEIVKWFLVPFYFSFFLFFCSSASLLYLPFLGKDSSHLSISETLKHFPKIDEYFFIYSI